jgi:hypothetical protein
MELDEKLLSRNFASVTTTFRTSLAPQPPEGPKAGAADDGPD